MSSCLPPTLSGNRDEELGALDEADRHRVQVVDQMGNLGQPVIALGWFHLVLLVGFHLAPSPPIVVQVAQRAEAPAPIFRLPVVNLVEIYSVHEASLIQSGHQMPL